VEDLADKAREFGETAARVSVLGALSRERIDGGIGQVVQHVVGKREALAQAQLKCGVLCA